MRSTRNICSIILAGCVVLLLAVGCGAPGPSDEEAPSEERPEWMGPRGVDPLELPEDRRVVPSERPRQGVIAGRDALVLKDTVTTDTGYVALPVGETGPDTLTSQAYRVQLFTAKLFSDARTEVQIAEEIFDQPVYLDYEVPYFKVRVGNFSERDNAERYRRQAQGAGYDNAWVVLVNTEVREAAPLYDELPLIPTDTTQAVTDTLEYYDDDGPGPPEE
ncbi:hypothetical protein GF420_04080 [candidate division GN15 bacterium]|nr:hypothetical protein [candidate division GN15 bacterium]